MAGKDSGLHCSFCGKGQREVKKLIAGPNVYICDECIQLCNDIIAEEVEKEEVLEQHEKVPDPKERVINIQNGPITVNQAGEIYQAGAKVSDLSVVEFKELELLQKEGNSLYINNSVGCFDNLI